MIKVNERCYIDVKFEGFPELVLQNFVQFILEEDANGVVIPTFELVLRQMDRSLYPFVVKKGLPITISFGNSLDRTETYTFLLSNHEYEPDEEAFLLYLNGMLDVKSFTKVEAIEAFEDTSDKVLAGLKSVTPEIDYEGDDKQIWIRHNISEKNFAERIIDHIHITEEDVPLAALTVDKQLIVKSAKKALTKDQPKQTFTLDSENKSPTIIRYNDYTLESDAAVFPEFIAEGRVLPVVQLGIGGQTVLTPFVGSVNNKETYSLITENVRYKPVLDSGNTHENYFQAWLNNLSHLAQFLLFNVDIDSGYSFLNNDDLKLLDTVEFMPNNPKNDAFVSSLGGRYIVSRKMTAIRQSGFAISFIFSRDFHV